MTDLTSFRVMRADLDRVLSFIEDHPDLLPKYGDPALSTFERGLRVLIHCHNSAEFDASVALLREAGGVETFDRQVGAMTYDKAIRWFGTVAIELQVCRPEIAVMSDRFASTHGSDAA